MDTIFRDSFRDLTLGELDLLLEAQRSVIVNGGTLGLYDDLSFVIGFSVTSAVPHLGILACRTDGDDSVWIQIAYTHPGARRQGVFTQLFSGLLQKCPGKKIGLGTQPSNEGMRAAAEKMGFTQRVVYLYRDKQ